VSVDRVEIKDSALPERTRRSVSRQAGAKRDRRRRGIAAAGESQASSQLADVASDQNSTLVMPLPVELLHFLEAGRPVEVGTCQEKGRDAARTRHRRSPDRRDHRHRAGGGNAGGRGRVRRGGLIVRLA
jgi:hypothetical protein